ncbi:MAG: hypothetical protein HXX12_14035 [Geothrix sp.]|uniref:hypothetical protein n=1 Tax=Geothrix sp. TaxID=1962974 RepID=UPI001814C61D|nr:hypothetical protein [Geothrix sp.]NWJ42078.1 hypothetical protein [Geothrix sp.]WIL19954.1 MAG: hypothetical protein QOZ81_002493 [Geothrix sp.]
MFPTLTLSVLLALVPLQSKGEVRAIVGPWKISVPEGVILLIKKGDQFGALRFSAVKPDQEKGWGSAQFESAFQGDGSGSFSRSNILVGKGKVHAKSLVGIGRVSFQVGHTTLKIGPYKFYYSFPNWVDMWPAGELADDYGFEFSLVQAKEFSAIDVTAPSLKWYRFDQNRRIEINVP